MTFSRTLIVGNVPAGIADGERRAIPPGLADPWGRVNAHGILNFGLRTSPGDGPLLIVTDADLTLPECRWLFGFADTARSAVVVSIRRLGSCHDLALLKARLENEIAHEAGHLRGLPHCRTARCVMRAVTDPRDLDRRPLTVCGRCRPTGWSARLRLAAAGLFLVAIVAALNLLMPLVAGPRFEMPFT